MEGLLIRDSESGISTGTMVRFREARLPGETSLGLDRETSPDTSDRLDPLLDPELQRVSFLSHVGPTLIP